MKMIAEIVEDIREELDGAEHYAKKSTQYKGMDDPPVLYVRHYERSGAVPR